METAAIANGLIDLAVHLDAAVGMHLAGGHLDHVYWLPAMLADMLAMSVVTARDFDHAQLVLHTMLTLHIDRDLAQE